VLCLYRTKGKICGFMFLDRMEDVKTSVEYVINGIYFNILSNKCSPGLSDLFGIDVDLIIRITS
jgi:hypothetical protein